MDSRLIQGELYKNCEDPYTKMSLEDIKMTKKSCMTNDCIKFEKDGDTLRDEKVLVELFNENYVNIVEHHLETSHHP